MSNKKHDHIYALFEELSGVKKYFYCGRTNNPSRRLKEHQYASKNGHELKYQHIRSLNGAPWDMEVLKIVPAVEYEGDYEDYYVIKLILEGHQLTNMKHGDAKQASPAELQEMMDGGVRTVEDVKAFRKEQARQKQLRMDERNEKAAAKAEALRLKIIRDEEDKKREAVAAIEKWERYEQSEALKLVKEAVWNAVPAPLKRITITKTSKTKVGLNKKGKGYFIRSIAYIPCGTSRETEPKWITIRFEPAGEKVSSFAKVVGQRDGSPAVVYGRKWDIEVINCVCGDYVVQEYWYTDKSGVDRMEWSFVASKNSYCDDVVEMNDE